MRFAPYIIPLIFGLIGTPALAKWDYCYYGEPPEGVNTYPEMPPRSFGFGYAAVPFAFKRLCGLPALEEAEHVRRIVQVYLQCSPNSDLVQEIEQGLTATNERLALNYFAEGIFPTSPQWDVVCDAAKDASSATLAFGDTWYYDSPTPFSDQERIEALFTAIRAWSSTTLEAKQ